MTSTFFSCIGCALLVANGARRDGATDAVEVLAAPDGIAAVGLPDRLRDQLAGREDPAAADLRGGLGLVFFRPPELLLADRLSGAPFPLAAGVVDLDGHHVIQPLEIALVPRRGRVPLGVLRELRDGSADLGWLLVDVAVERQLGLRAQVLTAALGSLPRFGVPLLLLAFGAPLLGGDLAQREQVLSLEGLVLSALAFGAFALGVLLVQLALSIGSAPALELVGGVADDALQHGVAQQVVAGQAARHPSEHVLGVGRVLEELAPVGRRLGCIGRLRLGPRSLARLGSRLIARLAAGVGLGFVLGRTGSHKEIGVARIEGQVIGGGVRVGQGEAPDCAWSRRIARSARGAYSRRGVGPLEPQDRKEGQPCPRTTAASPSVAAAATSRRRPRASSPSRRWPTATASAPTRSSSSAVMRASPSTATTSTSRPACWSPSCARGQPRRATRWRAAPRGSWGLCRSTAPGTTRRRERRHDPEHGRRCPTAAPFCTAARHRPGVAGRQAVWGLHPMQAAWADPVLWPLLVPAGLPGALAPRRARPRARPAAARLGLAQAAFFLATLSRRLILAVMVRL